MKHLRSLKERILNTEGFCTYNGSKCAVGALMTDEEQEKFGDFEGGVFCILEDMEEVGHESVLQGLEPRFLSQMQDLHDCCSNWGDKGFEAEDKAKMIANQFNLIYTKP